MLQFITEQDPQVGVVQQVQTALGAGVRWVQTGADRETLEKLIPMCKEHDAFLITEGDVELLEEFRVHGIHLSHATRQQVQQLRERVGGHAVIGVSVAGIDEALAFKGLDVDYLTFTVNGREEFEAFGIFVGEVKTARLPFHLVAAGDFPVEEAPMLIGMGGNAVAMGWGSFAAGAALEVAPEKVREQTAAKQIELCLDLLR